MSKDPDELLAEAADLVEHSGRWVNHLPGLNELCMLSALDYVGLSSSSPHFRLVCDAIGSEVGVRWGELWIWNDEPGRTKEEVATALRNAKRWLCGAGTDGGVS